MFNVGRPDVVRKELHWRTHKIAPGETLSCVAIGPPVCPVCHFLGKRTVPCLRAISEDALPCACDDTAIAKRRVAYLPLISNEGERIVVVVSNNVAYKLGTLPHRTSLRITRTRTPCAPLVVVRANDFSTAGRAIAVADKMPPQDIREYLLHLWNIDALTRWCASQASAEPVPPLAELAKPVERDTVEVPQAAAGLGATELRARLRRGRNNSG